MYRFYDCYENKSIRCGNIEGKKESEKLKGVLAAGQDFFFDRPLDGEPFLDYTSVDYCVDDKVFKIDWANNFYYGDNGAVVDAYDFSGLSEEEINKAEEEMIRDREASFPGYQFVLLPGRFPIDYDLTAVDPVVRSTHVLYLTNYQDFLEKQDVDVAVK